MLSLNIWPVEGAYETSSSREAAENGRDQAIQGPVVCDNELEFYPVFAPSNFSLPSFLQSLSSRLNLSPMTLPLTSPGLNQQQG